MKGITTKIKGYICKAGLIYFYLTRSQIEVVPKITMLSLLLKKWKTMSASTEMSILQNSLLQGNEYISVDQSARTQSTYFSSK